ncbi:alpha/beta hydrolase-fold protein [Ancylobacter sp. A5.8]|uniref:alpha/beta hydrolase n=1 Tax=Ancylobacter gelatini TaxID=2919920 RepID=UPI001F4DDD4A|nr:alpha/beta hydrolase-fold protein [Ancylobacter gelatini]MCJ8145141.1 alpha/beta hydrolase-fold protein [Ancylobacter gelatini]
MHQPVTLPHAHSFDLAAGEGPAWRIFIAVPRETPPPGGFPVLYLLDANAGFATLVEALRRGAERPQGTGVTPAVIVGIGYPAEGVYDRARRTFDYTAGPSAEASPPGGDARATGGRDAFLAFIEEVLKPRIARECPVDPGRQALIGHSLAGWFVLDVLCRNTACFQSYVAISPSIWWDEPRLLDGLAHLARGPRRLAVMVGEWEQQLAPWQRGLPQSAEMLERRARRAMADRARALSQAAAEALGPQARVAFTLMADEDHASIVPAAMTRALRFVLRP